MRSRGTLCGSSFPAYHLVLLVGAWELAKIIGTPFKIGSILFPLRLGPKSSHNSLSLRVGKAFMRGQSSTLLVEYVNAES